MEALAAFDFGVIWRYLPALLRGLWMNLALTVLGFVAGGLVLGTILAVLNLSHRPWLRWPAWVFVEFWRSTPLLVQAIWVHFSLPALTGITTTPFQSGLIALVFNVAAYCSEVIRAGILGVPRGQTEGARALGLKPWQVWRLVVLPQALRLVVPPMAGTVLSIFKATAILQILAINELMRAAQRVSSATFRPLEIYTAAAVLALLVGLAITLAAGRIEARFARAGGAR